MEIGQFEIEADEDENGWYMEHANTLAREILES